MDNVTVVAIRELLDMIETAERARSREDKGTEGELWYQEKSRDLQKTLKRMVNNAC